MQGKFSEQDVNIAEKICIITAQGAEITRIQNDLPTFFSARMDESARTVGERVNMIEQMIRDNDSTIEAARSEIRATQAEIFRVASSSRSNWSGGGNTGRKLLDPKNFAWGV